MTHRRPDPRQRDLDDLLRRALRTAADSVDPAADGLDRIRTKIAARRSTPVGWRFADLAVLADSPLRHLEPAWHWLRSILGTVAERFRPAPEQSGRYGWLRPAAGIATALFVVFAGYWALTALPQVIAPSANNGPGPGSVGNRLPKSGASAVPSSHSGSTPTATGSARSSAAPSCKPRSNSSHTPTPTPSATPSATATPTPSPSTSPATSPTPTTSPTGDPTPSNSSTGASSPGPSQVSASAAMRLLGSSSVRLVGVPRPKQPGPAKTTTPSPSAC